MEFFSELKRRNVIRVSISYLVVSWLLLQVVGALAEGLELPAVVSKVLIIILLVGYIPVVIFSWAFELTPDGIKRDTGQASSTEVVKKLDYITIGALILVLLTTAYTWFNPNAASHSATNVNTDSQQAPTASSLTTGIAVLPLQNLSADAENAYFAGGVHEEILTHLSRIKDLRVISRTSMLKLAESKLTVSQLGKQLDVSHLLEGSVRRSGNKVRVTVQLIDTQTDQHIWSQNYDRTLDDIFAIQTDIAVAIVKKLNGHISADTLSELNHQPTQNMQAYELYMQAIEFMSRGVSEEAASLAKPLLEQAIELDPDFRLAYLKLTEAYSWFIPYFKMEYLDDIQEVTKQMQSRWPDHPDTQLGQAIVALLVEVEHDESIENKLLYAQSSRPGDPLIYDYLAFYYQLTGQPNKVYQASQTYLELDPESADAQWTWVQALWYSGKIEQAINASLTHLQRFPRLQEHRCTIVNNLSDVGRDTLAYSILEQHGGPANACKLTHWVIDVVYEEKGVDAALAAYQESLSKLEGWQTVYHSNMALILRAAGRYAEAEQLIDQALNQFQQELADPFHQNRFKQMPAKRAAQVFSWQTSLPALKGDKSLYYEYRQKALNASSVNKAFITNLIEADAYMGYRDQAWAMRKSLGYMAPTQRFSLTRMANARWLYDQMFGDYPPYLQALAEYEQAQTVNKQ
ncbi:hypothetical protein [Paraglaciecola aestuariivivens]